MGEIAEAILDGVFCQVCGEYIGEEVGYPRTCAGCQCVVSDTEFKEVHCQHGETVLKRRSFRGGFHIGRYCTSCGIWIKWEKQTPAILKELQEREE